VLRQGAEEGLTLVAEFVTVLLDDAGVEHCLFEVKGQSSWIRTIDSGRDVLDGAEVSMVATGPGLHVMAKGRSGHDTTNAAESFNDQVGVHAGKLEFAREAVDLVEGGRGAAIEDGGIRGWVRFQGFERLREIGDSLQVGRL
jgi:hypothetical protein